MISITKIALAIPSNSISIENDYEKIGITSQHARILTKIHQLHNITIAMHESHEKLSINAINKIMLEESNHTIKYIIHLHSSPVTNLFGISMIRMLKYHYRLENAIYFSTSFNKCAALFKLLSLSSALFSHQTINEKILLISNDIAFTPELRIMHASGVTGDIAGAAIIQMSGDKNKILCIKHQMDGRFARGIWLNSLEQAQLNRMTTKTIETLIRQVLEEANLTIQQIKCIIPHNIHLNLWKILAKNMNMSSCKIYTALFHKVGHCFCSDFLINFFHAQAEGIIQPGDYVIATAIGVGSIFSVMLLQA